LAAAVVKDMKYAPSHEWAKVEGGVATIGISDFAQVNWFTMPLVPCRLLVLCSPLCFESQGELGDVVYVELPEVGSDVTKAETFGVVESVKVRWLKCRLTL
jgi:glycine cleavage system H protein